MQCPLLTSPSSIALLPLLSASPFFSSSCTFSSSLLFLFLLCSIFDSVSFFFPTQVKPPHLRCFVSLLSCIFLKRKPFTGRSVLLLFVSGPQELLSLEACGHHENMNNDNGALHAWKRWKTDDTGLTFETLTERLLRCSSCSCGAVPNAMPFPLSFF